LVLDHVESRGARKRCTTRYLLCCLLFTPVREHLIPGSCRRRRDFWSQAGVTIETVLPDPKDPEDLGVPEDGKGDLITAHEHRFCLEHEEDEWLLESAEKWMYAGDFNVCEAETTVEAKLQESEPYLRDFKLADCIAVARAMVKNVNIFAPVDLRHPDFTEESTASIGERFLHFLASKFLYRTWTPVVFRHRLDVPQPTCRV
jgi:hypothetical protein